MRPHFLPRPNLRGKVQKVDGQLFVLYSAVRVWMCERAVNFPLSEEDITQLNGPIPPEFFDN